MSLFPALDPFKITLRTLGIARARLQNILPLQCREHFQVEVWQNETDPRILEFDVVSLNKQGNRTARLLKSLFVPEEVQIALNLIDETPDVGPIRPRNYSY